MVEMLSPTTDYSVTDARYKPLFDSIEVLIDAFEIFGFNRSGYSPKRTFEHWCRLLDACPSGSSWMDVVKYKISAFFSAWSNQPLPKAPFNGVQDKADCILTGVGYRWIRSYLSSVSKIEFWTVLTTVLYSKKGFPRPDVLAVERATWKSLAFLTTTHEVFRHEIGCAPFGRTMESIETIRQHREQYPKVKRLNHLPEFVSRDRLKQEFERTVDELFGKEKFDPSLLFKPRFPSTSANYNRSRSNLGAFSEIVDVARKHFPDFIGNLKSYGKVYTKRFKDPRFYLGPRIHFDPVDTFMPPHRRTYRQEDLELEEESITNELYTTVIEPAVDVKASKLLGLPTEFKIQVPVVERFFVQDSMDLNEGLREVYRKVLELSVFEEPLVETVGLAEALKVRVISKGPPLLYTALQPIQKFTHSVLAKNRCFALIGKGDVDEGYLLERLGAKLPEDQSYLSGDYKSSTDYIDPYWSEVVVRRICFNLRFSEVLTNLYLRSLIGHIFDVTIKVKECQEFISYFPENVRDQLAEIILLSPWEDRKGEMYVSFRLDQQWGQLMGSITSFPILCIINATLCRFAMELSDGEIRTLEDARLMINGDDCLFRINKYGKLIWEGLGAYLGLQPSLGKVYYSKEYMNINSTSFFLDDEHDIQVPDRADPSKMFTRKGRFREVPFVNLGLLNGMSRSGVLEIKSKKEKDRDVVSISSKVKELLRGHSDERQCIIMKKFLNHNWDKLKKVRVPWFMPEWIGGLGLPWVGPKVGDTSIVDVDEWAKVIRYEYGPTEYDLLVATNILLNWNKRHPQSMPANSIWKVHEYVMGRLPYKPVKALLKATEKVPRSDFDSVYANLCNEVLLTEFPSDIIANKTANDPGIQVLRRNERLWSKTKPLRPACPLEKLIPRKTFDYFPCIAVC